MRVPAAARRAGWNIADQAVSSLSNLVVSVLIARSVDETAFGGFAVAFTIFALLTGISRACVTFPLGVRFADAPADRFAFAAASALGCSLLVSTVAGVCCLTVGLLIGGASGAALTALGVVFPGLILQEAWRNVFIAEGRASAAAFNTVFWAVTQVIAVWALLTFGKPTIFLLVLVWGGSAMAAALLGIAQSRYLASARTSSPLAVGEPRGQRLHGLRVRHGAGQLPGDLAAHRGRRFARGQRRPPWSPGPARAGNHARRLHGPVRGPRVRPQAIDADRARVAPWRLGHRGSRRNRRPDLGARLRAHPRLAGLPAARRHVAGSAEHSLGDDPCQLRPLAQHRSLHHVVCHGPRQGDDGCPHSICTVGARLRSRRRRIGRGARCDGRLRLGLP